MSILLPMTQFLEDANEVFEIVQERVSDDVTLQLGLRMTAATIIASTILRLTPGEHVESFSEDPATTHDQACAAMVVAYTTMQEAMMYAGSLDIPFPEGDTLDRMAEIQGRMKTIWTSVFG